MSDLVNQTDIADVDVVAGRDANVHYHLPPNPSADLNELIRSFKEDQKHHKSQGSTGLPENFIDELLHLSQPKQNEKIIGLEAKLKAAGRDDSYISNCQELKQEFYKKLTKHTFSESAQKIYLCLLNDVAMQFQNTVLPAIKAGASEAVVDQLIQDKIITVIQDKLGPHKFVLDLYARQVAGMLFFLTGNCHLVWTK